MSGRAQAATDGKVMASTPLYPRLLRLRHVHPRAWQRAVLGEGMAGVGALLAMADLASAWSILVLPVAVAGIVKAHDLLAGVLNRSQLNPSQLNPSQLNPSQLNPSQLNPSQLNPSQLSPAESSPTQASLSEPQG